MDPVRLDLAAEIVTAPRTCSKIAVEETRAGQASRERPIGRARDECVLGEVKIDRGVPMDSAA
jgi:hypothetical protein